MSLLNQFVHVLGVAGSDAAAPTNSCKENCTCHNWLGKISIILLHTLNDLSFSKKESLSCLVCMFSLVLVLHNHSSPLHPGHMFQHQPQTFPELQSTTDTLHNCKVIWKFLQMTAVWVCWKYEVHRVERKGERRVPCRAPGEGSDTPQAWSSSNSIAGWIRLNVRKNRIQSHYM